MEDIIKEIKKYRDPLIWRLWVNIWHVAGRWIFTAVWGAVFVISILQNGMIEYTDLLWRICMYLVVFNIGAFGFLGALSFIIKQLAMRRKAHQLGIPLDTFIYLLKYYSS